MQLNEPQKQLHPKNYLAEVSEQINGFIVGQPVKKNKFCEHIGKVIPEAEKYGQYLQDEWQKAKEAGLTLYDEKKDKQKWFWWMAFNNDWYVGECVYFAGDECSDVQFYIEGKPKPDPLCYLSSMIRGCVGQEYEGLERLDYQFVLLAIIHDAQNWQAGREMIYFNPQEGEGLPDRLRRAVWKRLESYKTPYEFKDVRQTIETAIRAVKADLARKKPAGTGQDIALSKLVRIIARLKNHPHSYGLTGGVIFLVLFLVVGLFKPQWRQWCWGVACLAFLVLIVSLLGGRSR